MKKNLRLLCLGLAAAAFTSSFAQEHKDMTSLLKNADMEQGLKGWVVDGDKIMGKNKKNLSTQTGFYGMGQGVLEAWNGNGNGLADSYIMQRVGGGKLPEGTYVFGAYIGASKQYHRKDVCEIKVTVDKNGKEVKTHVDAAKKGHKYQYWSNRDSVNGVEIFANEAVQRVATNNPDYNRMVNADGTLYNDGHATKFNVAVNLTSDYARPGYLTVGLRYKETNANYVVWDNATLYYFGDMSEAEALDAMARIDMDSAIAVADTLRSVKMNVDTLAALDDIIDRATKATITAANFEEYSNQLFWLAGNARRSETDYSNLKKNIESAEKLLDMDWQDASGYVEDITASLEEILTDAQAAYDAAELDRAELDVLRKRLNWTAGDLKMDSLNQALWDIEEFANEAGELLNQPGGYTQAQINALNAYYGEANDTFNVWFVEFEAVDGGDIEFEDREVNPNGLVGYIAGIYNLIEEVKNNPLQKEYTRLPIVLPAGEGGWLAGTKDGTGTENGLKTFKSDVFRFADKIEEITFTVKNNKAGEKFFTLSTFELYDDDDNLIDLEELEAVLTSDYCHITLNPDAKDQGIGLPGLIDNDPATFFHSAWANIPAGDHSFKVTLPEGQGLDAFSFRIVARGGGSHNHQFPAAMEVSVPMVERDALVAALNEAKACEAYSSKEVGFYEADYSYLIDGINKVDAALKNFPSEAECAAMRADLEKLIQKFNASFDATINLPVADKEYRIISGFPGFYEKQHVEKALLVHGKDTLWWGNVDMADKSQVFVFETLKDENGEDYIEIEEGKNDDGTTWSKTTYCYEVKNVGTGLYLTDFSDNKIVLSATSDTIRLSHLGRGQWNIMAGGTFHAGDHNGGNVGTGVGPYGGIYGVGSGICSYGGGLDGCSAWMILEYPALPVDVKGAGDKFKSECIHFEPANTVTLTANKNCKFTDLAFYDILGNSIVADTVVYVGDKATATFANGIVGCAFAFTNSEGVTSVSFNAFQYTPSIEILQAAYDKAVAVAPVEGTEVLQYADLSAYNAALEEAEAMIEAGAATDEAIKALAKKLEDVVAALKPNMPEAGKYYFIFCGDDSYEKNNGYRMGIRAVGSLVSWTIENELEWNRYWQFEPVTVDGVQAFYIKNLSNGKYMPLTDAQSTQLELTSKSAAAAYVIGAWGEGTKATIKQVSDSDRYFHFQGAGQHLVYWWDKSGVRSSWNIVEAQYDVTDIDFTEVETEKAVVKGTYDLFGRRIAAPTAPGIYIIDGKKKYIKK